MAKSVKLNQDLWERVQQHVEKTGFSSIEEFVAYAIDRELARAEEADNVSDVERRLKGLGYLE